MNLGFMPLEKAHSYFNINSLITQFYTSYQQEDWQKSIDLLMEIANKDFNSFILQGEEANLVQNNFRDVYFNNIKTIQEKSLEKALKYLDKYYKFYKYDNVINNLKKEIEYGILDKTLVDYTGEITHFFTHCLIAYPNLAFDEKNPYKDTYDKDCITINEFNSILDELYANDYVLIDIENTYSQETGSINKLRLPKNKKPLIFSFDDVVYDQKKIHTGLVDKLVLDDKNEIATYTSNNPDEEQIIYDNEFLTILENFIKQHPDFSFLNAKGIICLTGFTGILGYRTQSKSGDRNTQISKVTKLINRLKELNWKFACHSYGHYHMEKMTLDDFKKDTDDWLNEVATLIGDTTIYAYPYGEWDKNENAKQNYLKEKGFNLFFGVGINNYFNKIHGNLVMDRKPLDGYSLRKRQNEYKKYFDCEKIYDHENRAIPYKETSYFL